MIDIVRVDARVVGGAGEGGRRDEGREADKRAAPEAPRGPREESSPAACGHGLPRAAGGFTLR
eukprot:895745-Pleurochrysis_carterae.AAC.3